MNLEEERNKLILRAVTENGYDAKEAKRMLSLACLSGAEVEKEVDDILNGFKTRVQGLKTFVGGDKTKAIATGASEGLLEIIINKFWDDNVQVTSGPAVATNLANKPVTPAQPQPVPTQPVPRKIATPAQPQPVPTQPVPRKIDASPPSLKKIAKPKSTPVTPPTPEPVRMDFKPSAIGVIKTDDKPEKKSGKGWVWFFAIAAIVVSLLLFGKCNLNIGHDNLINNGVIIGGVVHDDCVDCDKADANMANTNGNSKITNGSNSTGSSSTGATNKSSVTSTGSSSTAGKSTGGTTANPVNKGSGTSTSKEPISPTPPQPRQNPNPVDPTGGAGKGDDPNPPGNNPGGGGTNPGDNPGTNPGTNPPGGDTNPPPETPPTPPEQPRECPCERKLAGQSQEYLFTFKDGTETQRIDFKAIFKDKVLEKNLAVDERFRAEIVYYDVDANGNEIEFNPPFPLTAAEQEYPITVEMLTKTGYAQSVEKSRIEWFKNEVGAERFCMDRFRLRIYNARVGYITSSQHFAFPL